MRLNRSHPRREKNPPHPTSPGNFALAKLLLFDSHISADAPSGDGAEQDLPAGIMRLPVIIGPQIDTRTMINLLFERSFDPKINFARSDFLNWCVIRNSEGRITGGCGAIERR